MEAVKGIYGKAAGEGVEEIERVKQMVKAFRDAEGRAPKIIVAKIGQDGHDRGQKVIASAFQDFGFDVAIGELFAAPEEVAERAVREKVHVIGVSSLTAGHLVHIPALKENLSGGPGKDIMIVIGGVIPKDDQALLQSLGVSAVFPPGTPVAQAAIAILEELSQKLGFAQRAAQ